jgi:enamine deaminase RidA (YjgF/YER057c/UK114 family)
MEEHMPALNGKELFVDSPNARLGELGIVLPNPPAPLGNYVESSESANLLFLTGMLPVVNRKLAVEGRLGKDLSASQGQEAARIAALNALATAQKHLGSLDRIKKLIKLTVHLATTAEFTEHARVADGASDLFVQIFGSHHGHARVVFGVQSLPLGAPIMVETIFEIERGRPGRL